jgi:hypothetical protein
LAPVLITPEKRNTRRAGRTAAVVMFRNQRVLPTPFTGPDNRIMRISGRNRPARAWVCTLAAALCSALMMLGLSGCRNIFALPPCMPPEFTVTPSAAKPGDLVTVSAPETKCDARYGEGAQVSVQVLDLYGNPVLDGLAPMTDDGGFTFMFTVPAGMSPGKAGVTAYPYNLDWCDDTGANNRAASGPQSLVQVSCAQRMLPLDILGS